MDASRRTIFITGASGFIGPLLLHDLLQKGYGIIVLLHNSEKYAGPQIDEIFERAEISKAYLNRVEAVFGDITKEDLGLQKDYSQKLSGRISEVWHLAASLSFRRRDRDKNIAVNLRGTQNVFSFAKNITAQYFFYVSTVYVRGSYTGIVYEKPMDRPRKFVNSYEETKWEAEDYIINNPDNRELAMTRAILRLSIVIGNEKYVPQNNFGYYNFLASLYELKKWLLGLPKAAKLILKYLGIKIEGSKIYTKIPFPCIHNKHLNLVPIDKVVYLMSQIAEYHRVNARSGLFIYNIADRHPVSLSVLFHETFRGLDLYIPIIHTHSFVLKTLFRVVIFGSHILPPLKRFARSIFYYQQYIFNESQYDTKNTQRIAGEKLFASTMVTPDLIAGVIRGFHKKARTDK